MQKFVIQSIQDINISFSSIFRHFNGSYAQISALRHVATVVRFLAGYGTGDAVVS